MGKSILRRLLKGPFCRTVVYYQILPNEWNKSRYKDEDIDYEILDELTCDKVLEIREDTVRDAFRAMCQRQEVVLATYKGEIAGHAVLKKRGDPIGKDRYWTEKEYIHYCFVKPEYRGHNIYPNMLTFLIDQSEAFNNGEPIFISADATNVASLRGIEKVGFHSYARCFEWGWGGIILIRLRKKIISKKRKTNV